MSIYVGNLNYEVDPEELSEVFAEYGKVKRVHLPTDRETGRVRGFAFVEMETEVEEDKAIETLDGAEWMGRQIKLNKARPRENRNSFSGRNISSEGIEANSPYGTPEFLGKVSANIVRGSEKVEKSPNALEMTIDIPDDASPERIQEIIKEAALRADMTHRSFGGNGLTVDTVEILVEDKVLEPSGK